MVIVTTAVYWRLSSEPRARKRSPVPLTSQHRAGVTPYTSPYGFARSCVFSKQSLSPGLCGRPQLRGHAPSPQPAPLLPKLRGHFAEFLGHSSPDRLGILYLTTCVGLGYGRPRRSLEAFLDSMGSPTSPQSAPRRASGPRGADLPTPHPTPLPRANHLPGWATLLRHPIACLLPAGAPRSPQNRPESPPADRTVSTNRTRHGRAAAGTGISTRCPSTTPVGLALGPDSPWADEPTPGTLGHTAGGILTRHSLLMPASSLAWRPRLGHPAASPATRRSPTHPHPSEDGKRAPQLRRCA